MKQLVVIKVGGNIIDEPAKLHGFLQNFAAIAGYKMLVHGGGKVATEIGKQLNIEPAYVNGRRITDAQTLQLVTMVYGGLINKNIVAALQALGCNAIGLTGADGNIIPASKRPVKEVDYGFVGDVESDKVNATIIKQLLEAGLAPVLAPLTHDGSGSILNTNADTIAQEVAKAMGQTLQVKLIYCFEKNGVLLDPDDDNSAIKEIQAQRFEELKSTGAISGGMIPKLENAFTAISAGVHTVTIGHADNLQALINGTAGTTIS